MEGKGTLFEKKKHSKTVTSETRHLQFNDIMMDGIEDFRQPRPSKFW